MDIYLSLDSPEREKEEDEVNATVHLVGNGENPPNIDLNANVVRAGEKIHVENGLDTETPIADLVALEEDILLEPSADMEFESKEEVHAFYQGYARFKGFNISIQNSRRSMALEEFIDAKFACSRYGTKRTHKKSLSEMHSRQGNKQDLETATRRRACAKTDCKACMHVKRRSDGKWIIHRFKKEHNHELFPVQAVSEQKRRMYAATARQSAEYKNVDGPENEAKISSNESQNLAMGVNNSKKNPSEPVSATTPGLLCIEDVDHPRSMNKTNNKKDATKKRKVASEENVIPGRAPEALQQVEKVNSGPVTVDGYVRPQQGGQGMVQLNLMPPTRDIYYANQQMIPSLAQLNSLAASRGGYYGTQPTMHGLVCNSSVQMLVRTPGFTNSMREEPSARSSQLRGDTSRHARG